MVRPKKEVVLVPKILTIAEREIALCYIGEGKQNMKTVRDLTGYSYGWIKKVIRFPYVVKFMDEELQRMGIGVRAVRRDTILETVHVSQGDIIEVLRLVMDDDGTIDIPKLKRLPKRLSAAVKAVDIIREERGRGEDKYNIFRTKIQMHDKVAALGLLDRMLHISKDPDEGEEVPEELKLVGMVVEGPKKKKQKDAIDADFEIVEEEEDSWLQMPQRAEAN